MISSSISRTSGFLATTAIILLCTIATQFSSAFGSETTAKSQNKLEGYSRYASFFFGLDLNSSEDHVVMDRTNTYDPTTEGVQGFDCPKPMDEPVLSTFEVFGTSAQVEAIISPGEFCSQWYGAYGFQKTFQSKSAAVQYLKSLPVLPEFVSEFRAHPELVTNKARDERSVTSSLLKANSASTLAPIFCPYTGVFERVEIEGQSADILVLSFFEHPIKIQDFCSPDNHQETQGTLYNAPEIVRLGTNRLFIRDVLSGSIVLFTPSKKHFCHFSKKYSFAVLTKESFVRAMELAELKIPTKLKKQFPEFSNPRINTMATPYIEAAVKEVCDGQ